MSNTGLQVFMSGTPMPAHVAEAFADDNNIREKLSLPTLSIAGKKFAMTIGGETKILTKMEDGEKINLSHINVVVLNQNPNRSRTFFAKPYVSGEKQVPACYSSDGVKPDADVKTPCAATCAACPNSVKGSRIKEGREGYACEAKKRLAIWPTAMLANPDLNIPPLQLILPITSIWDKENKQNDAEGWFAWDNYVDALRGLGAKHTGQVITRIKFDNTEHPKLLFKAVRWLDDADHIQYREVERVKAIKDSDEVRKLLFGRMYEEEHETETPSPATAKPVKAAPREEDDGFSQAVAAPPPAAAKPVKAAPREDDDGFSQAVAAPPPATTKSAAKPAAKPAAASKPEAPVAAVGSVPPELQDLLAQWKDD